MAASQFGLEPGPRRRAGYPRWSVRAGFPISVGPEESLEVPPRVFVGISEERKTKGHTHHLGGDQHDPSVGNQTLHLGERVERDTPVVYTGKLGGDRGTRAVVAAVTRLQPERWEGFVKVAQVGVQLIGAVDVH